MRKRPVQSIAPPESRRFRKGAFMILAAFCLILTIGFVAFSVDLGLVSLTRSRMQGAVDSAALAAAMEITHAVESAPPDETNITGYARQAAAQKAVEVAQMNGFYVDPAVDVKFGARKFDEDSGKFAINWSLGDHDPANVVKVFARRENSDLSQPDAKLRLFFASIFGDNTATLRTEATAYVEARDIVVVHDFSRSMNVDSYFYASSASPLSDDEIVSNLQTVYDDLQPLNLGSLGFEPQWLVVSRTNPNMSVTFRYSECNVTSQHSLKKVKLNFASNGGNQTITTSGTTGTYKGSGNNAGKNLDSVEVTASVPEQVPQPASVTQTGSPNVSSTFAGERKSVSLSTTSNWSGVELRFTNNSTQSFTSTAKSGTFSGSGSNNNRAIASVRVKFGSTWRSWINAPNVTYSTVYSDQTFTFADTAANVRACFGLNGVSYPYPSGSWDDYISYTRSNSMLLSKGYAEKYGGLTFVQYLLERQPAHASTPALATTRHYPFHAIKLGHLLLCTFLDNLGFNDYIGMVSYDLNSRVETNQSGPGIPTVDISAEPLGTNYQAVSDLMAYKQADHYNLMYTNIGSGMKDAVGLLDDHGRPGARPNIILMTDGNANKTAGNTTLPAGYQNWFNGFAGPGTSYNVSFDNPATDVRNGRLSLLYEVHQAVSKGYTIHTIAVGADADWQTMKAIAHYAGGEFIYVPGGTSTEEMEGGLMAAFHKIAGLVPPAKLVNPNLDP